MSRVRSIDCGRGIFVLPNLFAGGGIEALRCLFAFFAREEIQSIPYQRRGSIPGADGDFPLLIQFLGPGFRRVEPAGFGVTVRAAPLWPVLRLPTTGKTRGDTR